MKKLLAVISCVSLMLQGMVFPAVDAADSTLYEAENAVMEGGLRTEDDADASGGKVAGVFDGDNDKLIFTVDISTDGTYDLAFASKGIGGEKTNNVLVDGNFAGNIVSTPDSYAEAVLKGVLLSAGTHEIAVTKSWGWTYFDYLQIRSADGIPDSVYEVSNTLIDENASPETKALFSYLCESYGEKILSGQFAHQGLDSNEFKSIYEATGKYPAICGFDFMDYTPSRTALGAGSNAVDKAIQFHENGGIVTFCWHWNAPTEYLKEGTTDNGTPRWWSGFYADNSTFDIAAVMDGSDPAGKELLDRDIKEIAVQLKRLEDAGIPVLFRPLHEASGGWFWWGAKGADANIKLWRYLVEELNETYQLHNIIWIWNGQDADWYPGDEYVDIIGDDIYVDKHSYTASNSRFAEVTEFSESKKIVALTENGTIFDIDNVIATNAKWAWFCTWNGDFVTKDGKFSDEYTETEIMKKNYQSEYVITLDELPDFSTYLTNEVKGDVNGDGKFNVSDVVLLQKWLLAVPDTRLVNWKAADLCEDERLDVFDLCLMKQQLVNS